MGNATGDGDGHARREFAKWSSIPIPLTALEAKATEQKVDLAHGPWWLPRGQQSELWLANPEVERDGLRDSADNRDEKFKRIKTEEYLVASASGILQRLRPAMLTLMRNRTPVVRTERVFDSRRPLAEVEDLNAEKGDLFSSHVLAENQLFLTDLRFGSAELASLFWNRAKSLVGGDSKRRTWLRVGRGGCPVRVEAWKWVADVVPQQLPPAADSFTLTLTSDLISRADDLTFHTELDAGTVGRLAGNEVNVQDVSIDRKCSVSETRSVYGFNTAAGTRRSSATAIKRGSAFRVCGSHAALAPLFDALAALVAVGLGLGERQEEGFGRFALNHPAYTSNEAKGCGDDRTGRQAWCEWFPRHRITVTESPRRRDWRGSGYRERRGFEKTVHAEGLPGARPMATTEAQSRGHYSPCRSEQVVCRPGAPCQRFQRQDVGVRNNRQVAAVEKNR